MPNIQTQATESEAGAAAAPRSGVRGRILLIGALATAAAAFLVTQAEMVLSSLRIGYLQFPPVALGLLLVVVAISRGLRRLSARWGLSSSDLLVIYVHDAGGGDGLLARHRAEVDSPAGRAAKYFADQTNNWHGLYQRHLPPWLFPTLPHGAGKDPAAV